MTVRRILAALATTATLGGVAALTAPAAHAAPGTGTGTDTDTDTLTNREWHIRVPGVPTSVYDLGRLTIARDGRVTGTDGCNRVTGRAVVDAARGTVTFADTTWTQRACRFAGDTGNAYVAASAAMSDVLDGTTARWAVSGSTLKLTSGTNRTTTWTTTMPASTSTTDTVSGRRWHLAATGGLAQVDPALTDAAWFTVTGGRAAGSDGCNNIMGEATVDPVASTITFPSLFSTTRMACLRDTEQAQLDADVVSATLHETLSGTVNYVQVGARLLVTGPDGTTVTFVR